jgi:catechol 2,3-dioxygenase
MKSKQKTMADRNYAIHPDTRLGTVSLTVADLSHQIAFYLDILGLRLHWREGSEAGLGVGGEDLLHLVEKPGARRVQGRTGIYHFALLLPSRKELARAIARLFQLRYPNHPTDHVVSKTTYLDDAEGNNIELYIYSPEDGTMDIENGELVAHWADGRPSSGREPLDVDTLFRELSSEDDLGLPLPPQTVIGHVHLYGSNLDESMHFYRDILGFKEGGLATSFRFADVSLDRPHVIAFNTWQGEGAPPPPPDSLGLRHFTIILPNEFELDQVLGRVRQAGIAAENTEEGILVRDPAQNVVLITQDRTD